MALCNLEVVYVKAGVAGVSQADMTRLTFNSPINKGIVNSFF